MGLVPNPVADLKDPLDRTQKAVESLSGELAGVKQLPAIHDELVKLNATMSAMLEATNALRADLARPR